MRFFRVLTFLITHPFSCINLFEHPSLFWIFGVQKKRNIKESKKEVLQRHVRLNYNITLQILIVKSFSKIFTFWESIWPCSSWQSHFSGMEGLLCLEKMSVFSSVRQSTPVGNKFHHASRMALAALQSIIWASDDWLDSCANTASVVWNIFCLNFCSLPGFANQIKHDKKVCIFFGL